MIKVSVVVPAYNAEKYIAKCMASLVGQTLECIEIIVIDDGSTDSTLDIIKEYHEKYPEKIVFKSVKNGGAAAARNIALKLAQGEYIGFVDSDDDVSYTMFEKMYNLAVSRNADIVTCGYNKIDIDFVQKKDIKQWECFGHDVYEEPELFLTNVPFIWNKIFKRELIEKNNIAFEENLSIYEDMVFTYQLFLKANKIERVSEALYNYVAVRKGSLTHAFSKKRFDIVKAYDILIDYYKKNNQFERFKDELLFILLDHIFVVLNGTIPMSRFLLMQNYISTSFAYLDKTFPQWKKHKRYFAKRRKKKKAYISKLYWRVMVSLPKSVKVAKVTWENFKKYKLEYSRAGNSFIKAYKSKPISEKAILINSQHGDNLNGNMFYILKALCKDSRFSDYKIGIAYKKDKKEKFQELLEGYGLNNSNIKWLPVNSEKYAEYLATAKYLFNDTSFPVYFVKRDEQVYINTWHGTPLKKLGRGQDSDYHDIANLQKNFLAADYLLYPNEYMKDHMIEDYMIGGIYTGEVLMSGYPRNEVFFDDGGRNELRQALGIAEKQNITYMPTWRGSVRAVDDEQIRILEGYLGEMDSYLREDQHMYVNLHPYVADKIDYSKYKNIDPFPSNIETYDFLNACDVLITDYSSVFFDFAVTGRKIVLFAYDEEDYMRHRGMYMNLDELPFTKVADVKSLMEAVNDQEHNYGQEFIDKFCSYERNDMSLRICDLVINGEREELELFRLPVSEKNKVMVHMDAVKDAVMVEKILDMVERTDLNRSLYYTTYNMDTLMGKEKYLKQLPAEMRYFGRFGAFKAGTLMHKTLLMLLEKHPCIYKLFRQKMDSIFDIENKRAFVDCCFDMHIMIGADRISDLCRVLSLPGKKVLHVSEKDLEDMNVPKWLYEKFDDVIMKGIENLNIYNEQ